MRSCAVFLDRAVWTLQRPSRALLLLAAGCSGPVDQWGCEDAECRQSLVVDTWETSPALAVEQIHEIPDGLERISVVSALIDHHPSDADVLCELLPHSMSKTRCLYVADHAELWALSSSPSEGGGQRAGIGPSQSSWDANQFEVSDLINVKNPGSLCSSEVDPHACSWSWALERVGEGDAQQAAEMCASVSTVAKDVNRWRHFCFYAAGLTHGARWGRTQLSDTARLCGASGRFQAQCVDGVLVSLASSAPPSDVGSERAWSDHLLRASAVQAAWSPSPMLAEIIDRFWALSLSVSASKSNGLSGDALDVLPATAVPHLHAALAFEWAQRLDGPADYAGMRDQVLASLSVRLDRQYNADTMGQLPDVVDYWPIDREGEAHFAAVSYLGRSRRTVARDSVADIGLCVLEAAARTKPPALGVLETARTLPDERLRWTAARLLEQLKAE